MTKESVLEKLRRAMKTDGRDAPFFAEELGVNPVTVRLFRSGARTLGNDKMEKLAGLLGFKVEWELVKK